MAYFRCGGGLPTQAKAVTATTSQQIVLPDEGNVLESVTVNPQNHTDYYPSASTYYNVSGSESINLGANHNYRYVRVKGATPSGTYPVSSLSDNSSINDMGTSNWYRYVSTSGMYKVNNGTYNYGTVRSNGTITKTGLEKYSGFKINVEVPVYEPNAKWDWLNAYTTSSFSAQTIQSDVPTILLVDTSCYILAVEYKESTSSANYYCDFFPLVIGNAADRIGGDSKSPEFVLSNGTYKRRFTVGSSYVDGEYCYNFTFTAATGINNNTSNNAQIIPTILYIFDTWLPAGLSMG